jgi:hypothetical protein
MNLTLKEVVQTSPEGDRFFRLPEVYVRGNNVRLIRTLPYLVLWRIRLLTASALDKISESSRRGCRIGQGPAAESALESGPRWTAASCGHGQSGSQQKCWTWRQRTRERQGQQLIKMLAAWR